MGLGSVLTPRHIKFGMDILVPDSVFSWQAGPRGRMGRRGAGAGSPSVPGGFKIRACAEQKFGHFQAKLTAAQKQSRNKSSEGATWQKQSLLFSAGFLARTENTRSQCWVAGAGRVEGTGCLSAPMASVPCVHPLMSFPS